MNKKGFTLIEIIAVIVIIGVLLLIAVPAVSSIIFSSRDKTYATNASTFMSEVDTLYKTKQYGPLLEENQIMIVPIKDVTFDKNNFTNSPYGAYVYNKSYVIIERSNYGYKLYATILDDSSRGVLEAPYESINNDDVKVRDESDYVDLDSYYTCTQSGDGCDCDTKNAVFRFKSNQYKPVETRDYNLDGCVTADGYYPLIVMNKQ